MLDSGASSSGGSAEWSDDGPALIGFDCSRAPRTACAFDYHSDASDQSDDDDLAFEQQSSRAIEALLDQFDDAMFGEMPAHGGPLATEGRDRQAATRRGDATNA